MIPTTSFLETCQGDWEVTKLEYYVQNRATETWINGSQIVGQDGTPINGNDASF